MGKPEFSALRRSFEARESSDYTIAAVFEKSEVEKLYTDTAAFLAKASKIAREQVKKFS